MATEKRTALIEKKFSESFQAELKVASADPVKTEVPLKLLGGKPFWPGTTRGSVDIYLPTMKLGIECKAVRLPRNKDTELFDISQLASDALRIRSCAELHHGYIVIFVYGPLVLGTTSESQLYRAFHNGLFVDLTIAKQMIAAGKGKAEWPLHCRRAAKLGWGSVWSGRSLPSEVVVKRTENVGAICIDCKPGTPIPRNCHA
jgi:hypothetical protein